MYMPLARVENGMQANISAEVKALHDLLLKFDNLTNLTFGLGVDSTHRPPLEQLTRRAFGTATFLPAVRALSIEDSALFWMGICPQLDDLTLYLGHRSGTEDWPIAPAVHRLTLHNTSCCHAAGWRTAQVPPLSRESENKENLHPSCGPGKDAVGSARWSGTERLMIDFRCHEGYA